MASSKLPYEMTIKQYTDYKISSSKYSDKMRKMPEVYNEDKYFDEWKELLLEASIDNVIPEVVIRSLVIHLNGKRNEWEQPINGMAVITNMFRGRYSKGIEAWLQSQVNKMPKKIYSTPN